MMLWQLTVASMILLAGSVQSQNTTCDCKNKEDFNADTGFYVVTYMKANWYQALEHCRSLGLNLVSVTTKEKSDRLKLILRENGVIQGGLENGVWTSGSDWGEEYEFVWAGSGEPITFTDWHKNEPNHLMGERERCIHYTVDGDPKDYGWNDDNCDLKTYFVCEI